MECDELERRLIDFVNRMHPDADPPLAIDAETALFEDGVINSLRILDLIAFVEEITRTRIPDAMVRLANFRSVRAIVVAFGEDDGERSRATEGPSDAAAPLHVFERRSHEGGFARPVEELVARGELELEPPGRLVFGGSARRLAGWFDSVVQGWAGELGATEDRAAPLHGVPPAAACYHVYHGLKGARLESSPVFVTTRGRCFRDEADFRPSLGRLRVFEMREIVALGSREGVEEFRRAMIDRVRNLVTELDLAGRIEIATDPFFLQGLGNEARGRRLMQQVLPLKYELRLALDASGCSCAVASFNHHLDFFGRRFGIRLDSGATAHTGCVAFGLERWVLAYLGRHGTDRGIGLPRHATSALGSAT